MAAIDVPKDVVPPKELPPTHSIPAPQIVVEEGLSFPTSPILQDVRKVIAGYRLLLNIDERYETGRLGNPKEFDIRDLDPSIETSRWDAIYALRRLAPLAESKGDKADVLFGESALRQAGYWRFKRDFDRIDNASLEMGARGLRNFIRKVETAYFGTEEK